MSRTVLSRLNALCLCAAALLSAGFAASAQAGGLSVKGSDILGPDGKPIVLRGWNWGRWGKTQPGDGAENAAQGANVVRIPLRWWGAWGQEEADSYDPNSPETGYIKAGHLKMLDGYVKMASDNHLWIVLFIDSNCGQNGTQDKEDQANHCDPKNQYSKGHNFWTDRDKRAQFVKAWQFVANRYKNVPYLGIFEPLPEPAPPSASQAEIAQFYDELMTAIRQVAPGIPFLVGSEHYRANQVEGVYNPKWKDVIYTGNFFTHKQGNNIDKRLQSMLEFRKRYQVPLFVQQVGSKSGDDPNNAKLKQVLDGLSSNNIGWTLWEYRASSNPNSHGVNYSVQGGAWRAKPEVMRLVTSYFKR